jgi:hypothetical protein
MNARDMQSVFRSLGFAELSTGEWLADDLSVCLIVHPVGMFVGWVDTAWPHPSEPVRQLKDVEHYSGPDPESVSQAVATCLAKRERALQTCQFCERTFTPGNMVDSQTCHGCASAHQSVVF